MSERRVYRVPTFPPIESIKEVGVYCRVSTNSPEQMNSLATQVSELVRLVRRAGMIPLKAYLH